MAHTIEHFMWGFQSHFRIGAQVRAESVFALLTETLDSDVLLVGRLGEDRSDRHPLCVEPEDGVIGIESLVELDECIEVALSEDPENSMFQSHPVAEKHRQRRVHRRGFAGGVERALNEAHPHRRFFACHAQSVDAYLVTAVVHVDRTTYDHFTSLIHREYLHRFTVAVSLLDATVQTLLEEFSEALAGPSPGDGSPSRIQAVDALREAGRSLMDNPGGRLGETAGHPRLFDRFCELAALRYEGAEKQGRILLTGADRSGVGVVVSFTSPVRMDRPRESRKLFEMASDTLDILATPQAFYGLGKLDPTHDHTAEDVFEVVLLGKNAWEFRHDGRPLMRVQDGHPSLPGEDLEHSVFEWTLKRAFSNSSTLNMEQLWMITSSAMKQRHGTLVVISSDAGSEADRLKGQSMLIDPLVLTEELVSAITAIDGAVLVNAAGVCHAVGVILDGEAVVGDRSRGSRYNSALCYVETVRAKRGHIAVAVVVSEDGSVDLLPAYRPPIQRAELDERLDSLRALGRESDPSTTILLRTIRWIRDHRFYLSATTCEEVTTLVEGIESAWRNANEGGVHRSWGEFVPHPEFDESYLIEG